MIEEIYNAIITYSFMKGWCKKMVLFIIMMLVLGVLFIGVCLGCTGLIEPIIGILIFCGIVKGFKKLIS